MPQALVIDLDGTLLRTNGTVSARSIESLLSAKESGIHIAFATARPLRLVFPLIQSIGMHPSVIIASSGAVTYDPCLGTAKRRLIPGRIAKQLMTFVRATWPNAVFGFETGDCFMSDKGMQKLVDQGKVMRDSIEATSFDPDIHECQVALVASKGIDNREVADQIRKELGSTVSVRSDETVALVSHISSTKRAAFDSWAQINGVDVARVVAMGDGDDDVELIAHAGLGVCPSNAPLRIQLSADLITASNDNDGVAELIFALLGK